MAINLHDVQNNHPFLTLIKVAKEEYLGIVQNCDEKILSLYSYEQIPASLRNIFLEHGKSWWWESNRKLPINIFIGESFAPFRPYLLSFSLKECEVLFGPTVQLSDLTNSKRIRRKTVQLIRRVN
tara:strand:+ start:1456 stop:1830 length:375 start_codon:yes stop_codon:yes gene_type:complete